jgi:uncharacterized membrane protein YhaH (DUF805 family)
MPMTWGRLFAGLRGRIPRSTFWFAVLFVWAAFIVAFLVLEANVSRASTLILYPLFFWTMFALAAKRYHDLGRSAAWLLLLLIPVVGVVWVAFELGFRRGTRGENRHGPDPLVLPLDYQTVK